MALSFPPELSIVVPVFNEEPANLEKLLQRLQSVFELQPIVYEVILVDDGSREPTARILRELPERFKHVRTIVLSRNFGEQAAICAGLAHTRGRATINMDSDLQDPPELIPTMLKYWQDGYDVVYTQQVDRSDSPLRLLLTNVYYWLLQKSNKVSVSHAGEFRLLSKKAVTALLELSETTVFLRYLVPFIGFKQITIPFKRQQRLDGVSSYTLIRLLKLGISGLISATSAPLIVVPLSALLIAAVVGAMYILLVMTGHALTATLWQPLMFWLLMVLNMLSITVLSLYVSTMLTEVRARPLYIVSEEIAAKTKTGGADVAVENNRISKRRDQL